MNKARPRDSGIDGSETRVHWLHFMCKIETTDTEDAEKEQPGWAFASF